MKKFKYIKFLIIVGLLLSTACTKDWLELKPYGKTDMASYYQTDDQISAGTVAIYDMLSSADQLFGWSSNFIMRNLPDDFVNCGGGNAADQAQYQAIDQLNWSTENAGIVAYWTTDYYGIYRANLIIANKGTSAIATRSIAEAKCLRAYFYLDLVIRFGDVPLRIDPTKGLTDILPRAPKADVYAQIDKDLTEAAAVLPNKSGYAAADKFRCSKQTCYGLLVKSKLWQKDYAGAIAAFTPLEAVEGTEVGLASTYASSTKIPTEFGIESLLEANFIAEGKDWGSVSWNRVANDNRHIQLCGPRSAPGGDLGINAGWGFMPPTQKFYDFIAVGDPRKQWIILNGADMATHGAALAPGWETEDCIRMKYTTFATETTGPVGELNFGTNWRLLHYADVLLMAAEAYYNNGDENSARDQINKVRNREGAGWYTNLDGTTTGTALMDAIKYERGVELAYEGSRYWDLVRWGDAASEITGFTPNKNELFPIPLQEVNAGNGIVTQNPGY